VAETAQKTVSSAAQNEMVQSAYFSVSRKRTFRGIAKCVTASLPSLLFISTKAPGPSRDLSLFGQCVFPRAYGEVHQVSGIGQTAVPHLLRGGVARSSKELDAYMRARWASELPPEF
jgi:hypothetical protein